MSETYKTILLEQRDRTLCVTLNRPEKLNAISDEMIAELNEVYERVERDSDIWTLIITGAGRALSSGADVGKAPLQDEPGWPAGIDTQGEPKLHSYRQWDAPQEATPPWMWMSKPIICAVNGIVAGAGLDFVTTSDIVIASDTASFFDPHVSIGVVSGREALRLARVLPLNVAMRLALLGKHDRMPAARACELGLVSEVVPADELMNRAWELADLMNLNAPLAVRGTRMAIRKGLSLPVYEAELLAENYRMKVAVTDDAKEGSRAFTEKRAPKWTGT